MGFFDFLKGKREEPLGQGMNDMGLDLGHNLDSSLGNMNMPGMPPDMGLPPAPMEFGAGMDMGSHSQFQPNQPTPTQSVNLSSMGMGSMQSMPSASFQAMQQPQQGSDFEKDIQILSLKLDAIKSQLDSVNQRVANIERIAEREQQLQAQQQQKRWY